MWKNKQEIYLHLTVKITLRPFWELMNIKIHDPISLMYTHLPWFMSYVSSCENLKRTQKKFSHCHPQKQNQFHKALQGKAATLLRLLRKVCNIHKKLVCQTVENSRKEYHPPTRHKNVLF